jgi:membrane protein involved in colicin uptake
MDGSGNEADGNAKAEGEAQGKAKGKAKTKAKAKPKAEVQGGEEIDASPMWGEPLVKGPSSDGPQAVSDGSQAEGLAQAKAQTDVKVRAWKGTTGTFASRRPPKCPQKRAKFYQPNQVYLQ